MNAKATSPARSAILTISMRWLDRVVGIASTLILARLLVPDDFGIVAMATIVVGIADTLFAVGVHIPLIQNPRTTNSHYYSAWTLRFMQTWLVAIGLLLAAPYASEFFSEPRLTPVLRVLTLLFVLEGLENIWTIEFQKKMQFQKDFYFMASKRLITFVITIGMALYLQNYWAMIFGNVAGRVVGVLLSYGMHPNRPKFCLTYLREIFGVSQWMIVKSAGNQLNSKISSIVMGHRTDTSTLGAFSLSSQIALMPSAELVTPVNRVLFPMFSNAKDKPPELRRLYILAQSLQMLVALPACIGMALIAKEFVPAVLGDDWLSAIEFIQLLAFFALFTTMQSSGSFVLITLGKLKWLAFFGWGKFLLFCAIALWWFPSNDPMTIVYQRLVASAVGLAVYLTVLLHAFPALRLVDILTSLYRPSLGILAMTAAVFWFDQLVMLPIWSALLSKVVLGAAVYVLTVVALWLAGRRPPGAEQYLLELIRRFVRKQLGEESTKV